MKVLLVVSRRYNGHELWTALGVLQERGHQVEVVSTSLRIEDEVTGQRNRVLRTIDATPTLEEFDALMFVSGNMADTEAYWDDPRARALVADASQRNAPIAAICCSVPAIRDAAKGKKVSFFPLLRSRERLVGAGAIPQTVAVTVDGVLVTAEHQMATQMWAEAFCDVLDGKDPNLDLHDSGYTPPGRRMRPDPDLERIRNIVKKTGKTEIK